MQWRAPWRRPRAAAAVRQALVLASDASGVPLMQQAQVRLEAELARARRYERPLTVGVVALEPAEPAEPEPDRCAAPLALFLAGAEAVGHTLHFGSGREIRIADLAHLIGALSGGTVDLRRDAHRVRPEASEVQRLVADTTRAQELLGWTPQVTLEDGLRGTIAWVERHLETYRPAVYAV